jgi:hypothetical protein
MQTTKVAAGFLLLSVIGVQMANAQQCQGKAGSFALAACQVASARAFISSANAPPPELNGKAPALSTGWGDAIHLDSLPSTVEPSGFTPLTKLRRLDDGEFVLQPGFFELSAESFSLEPGDCGNRAGAAFLPAPIRGRRAEVVASILKNTELHPEIAHNDIQALLWAITAGTDFEKMPPAVQQTAGRILPRELVAEIQGSVQAKAAQKALMVWLKTRGVKLPFAAPSATPAVAAVAVAPNPAFTRGTWAGMPGGWFVRYTPDGCSKTRVQIIVPDTAFAEEGDAVPVFDPTAFVAVYMASPQMRLGVTLRPAK